MFEKLKKTTYNFKTKQFKVNYDTLGNIANVNPTGIVQTSVDVLNLDICFAELCEDHNGELLL